MEIRFDKQVYSLGEPVEAHVRYRNRTGGPLAMPDPSSSPDVYMHALDLATGEELSYPMVREEFTPLDGARDVFVLSQAPVPRVTLPPDGTLDFTTDLNTELYLRPGSFDCTLTDGDLVSNRVAVRVELTQRSVDLLLALARDPDADYGRREWAEEWLRGLKPDFALRLAAPDEEASVKAKKEAHNQKAIMRFLDWWKKNRASLAP